MSEEKNVKDDYEYSRETYYDLLEKGKESMELMIEVARESEHPRAFEVLSTMMKKKNKDINKKDEPKQLGNTTNNLFVGTTTDLQRLIHAESGVVIDADKSE